MATKSIQDLLSELADLPQDNFNLDETQLTQKRDLLTGIQDRYKNITSDERTGMFNTVYTTVVDALKRRPTIAKNLDNLKSAATQIAHDVVENGADLSTAVNKLYGDNPNYYNVNTIIDEVNSAIPNLKHLQIPSNTKDITKQLGDVQGILNPLVAKNKQEAEVNAYLNDLPGQNDKQISEFEKTLQNSQSEFFGGSLASQIIQAMNARGIVNSGDTTDSLTSAAAGLQRDVKNTIAPIRLQANQDVSNKKYENILRGALEQGQSLSSAVDFARNLYSQDLQNQFTASQADLNRKFQSDQYNQQMALRMALSRASDSPSGMDYFLQYGLPVLGTVAGGFAGPWGAALGGAAGSAAGGAATRRGRRTAGVNTGPYTSRQY